MDSNNEIIGNIQNIVFDNSEKFSSEEYLQLQNNIKKLFDLQQRRTNNQRQIQRRNINQRQQINQLQQIQRIINQLQQIQRRTINPHIKTLKTIFIKSLDLFAFFVLSMFIHKTQINRKTLKKIFISSVHITLELIGLFVFLLFAMSFLIEKIGI